MDETLDKCLIELRKSPQMRNKNIIASHLNTIPQFMEVVENDLDLYPGLVHELGGLMKLYETAGNELIFRYGERDNMFYILLRGKAALLKVKKVEYNLTSEEYISHLLKLRKNHELELLHQTVELNKNVYQISEDNFDTFMRNISRKQSKNALYADNLDVIDKVNETLKFLHSSDSNKNRKDYRLLEYIDVNSISKIPIHGNFGRNKCIIPEYEISTSIESGSRIGTISVGPHQYKRLEESLIAIDECTFVSFEIAEYDNYIKAMIEKKRRKFMNLIYSFSIFQSVSRYVFEKKYYDYFSYKKFKRNSSLITEGETSDEVYFILSGEFEFYTNRNIVEVNELIVKLKNVIRKLNRPKRKVEVFRRIIEEEEKENEDLLLNKNFKTKEQNKVLFERQRVRLGICHQRDIIGMMDYIDIDNDKGLVNSKCLSFNGEAYITRKGIFMKICQNEETANELAIEYQLQKINILIERLNHHKQSVYAQIKRKDDMSVNSHIEENLKEQKMNQKNRFYSCEMNSIFTKNAIDVLMGQRGPSKKKTVKEKKEGAVVLQKRYIKRNERYNRGNKDKERNREQMQKRNLILNTSANDSLGMYKNEMINRNVYDNMIYSYVCNTPKESEVKKTKSHIEPIDEHCAHFSDMNYVDCLILDKFNSKYYSMLNNYNNLKQNN